MTTKKLQVGDRVRVIRKIKACAGWADNWVPSMDHTLNMVGKITRIEYGGYDVSMECLDSYGDLIEFNYPRRALKLEPAQKETKNDALAQRISALEETVVDLVSQVTQLRSRLAAAKVTITV